MRLSRYTLTVPIENQVLVAGLLRRTVILLDADVWSTLLASLEVNDYPSEALPSGLFEQLRDSRIIVDQDFDEFGYVRIQSAAARIRSDVVSFVLVPTMNCNMACHYCFENSDNDAGRFDAETAENIVEHARRELIKTHAKMLHVRWFGGEPLQALTDIQSISKKLQTCCQELGRKFHGDIITNGVGLNRQVAVTLRECGIRSAQITFEGEKRRHDKIRRVSKQGSYDEIVRNVLSGKDYLSFTARVHVAPYNIEGVPELLLDLQHKGLHEILQSIYFAPLFNYRQGDEQRQFQGKNPLYLSSLDFSRKEVELLRRAIELGFTTNDPLDADYGACTALRECTTVINMDGTLAKCYLDAGDRSEIFSSLDGSISSDFNLTKWMQSDFLLDADCAACKFAPVCMGGCTKKSMKARDKSAICTSLKYNFKSILPLYYS